MYDKEFDNFGNILGIKDFKEVCMNRYDSYLDTVIEFKENKEAIYLIFEKYKTSIIEMIKNSEMLKDRILTEEHRIIRHDKSLEEVVDFQKVAENILIGDNSLNSFEERTKHIILLEVAKLINYYGMDELVSNQGKISKEMRLGIFEARNDRYLPKSELDVIEQRINISEIFGEESIPYIENYSLLKERIHLLKKFSKVPEEIEELDDLISQLNQIDIMMELRNAEVVSLLKQAYNSYETINRKMILARLNTEGQEVINDQNDERLLLLHFIPDFKSNHDCSQDKYFEKAVQDWIKTTIETKYARKYDPEKDAEEASQMYQRYKHSRSNPFNLSLRIPIKNRYTNDSFYNVITAPHTNLSCSISKAGDLSSHLDRKIAIGFSTVPVDAIKTINEGYNNALDRFSFEENSVALPEVLEHIARGGTNETLIDWTKLVPSYILVIKDTEKISEDLLIMVEKYSKDTGLPIKIYDAYELERRKRQEIRDENTLEQVHPIEGVYSSNDLSSFAKTKPKESLIPKIKAMTKSKHREKEETDYADKI